MAMVSGYAREDVTVLISVKEALLERFERLLASCGFMRCRPVTVVSQCSVGHATM
jgi:hypothetical protein